MKAVRVSASGDRCGEPDVARRVDTDRQPSESLHDVAIFIGGTRSPAVPAQRITDRDDGSPHPSRFRRGWPAPGSEGVAVGIDSALLPPPGRASSTTISPISTSRMAGHEKWPGSGLLMRFEPGRVTTGVLWSPEIRAWRPPDPVATSPLRLQVGTARDGAVSLRCSGGSRSGGSRSGGCRSRSCRSPSGGCPDRSNRMRSRSHRSRHSR